MKFYIILVKDSNRSLCKLMQQELLEKPPAADIIILHTNNERNRNFANKQNIKEFPTIILCAETTEIKRFTGYIDSETIDNIFKQYEAEHMV